MKPWTAIFVNDTETLALDVIAPWGATEAEQYVQDNFTGNLVALIPGRHVNDTLTFAPNKDRA